MGRNAVGRAVPHGVLYREGPAWLVPDGAEGSGLPYPGDYAGIVIAVRPEGHEWGPGDLVDARRKLVTLELTRDEAGRLASGELKIAGGKAAAEVSLEEVSFADRWGAIAPAIRARLGGSGSAEVAEEKAGANAARDPHETPDPEGEEFERLAAALRKALPQVVVHSGAGLYEVGPGKTYSTIQSALDQLWTDQGSAVFTASQYIRIFAGTYAENVTANASLDPDEGDGHLLVIEGDPADDRAHIVISPSGGTYGVSVNCDSVTLRHLKISGTPTSWHINAASGSVHLVVDDCECVLNKAIYCYRSGTFRDSTFTAATDIWAVGYAGYGGGSLLVERCRFTGPGKASSTTGALYGLRGNVHIEASIFSGWDVAVREHPPAAVGIGPSWQILNCSIYDCGHGLLYKASVRGLVKLVDTVFSGVDVIFDTRPYPDETATVMGCPVVLRNNCFHSYTSFADDGAATKTYAQFAALSQVDASGDLDATDPKLTNPAAGDFSLQSGSPCRHAGHGSGVVTGQNDVAFDAHHPDIGAWSSGTISAPGRPSAEIASVVGDTITVGIEGDAGSEHKAELVRARTGEIVDTATRDGDGEVSLTAPELPARYFVVVSSANAAGRSLPTVPCEVFVSAGPGPFEDVRIAVVSRLKAHAGLAALLGTDETGGVPVYAAGPGKRRKLPCLVYTLGGRTDEKLNLPGRWTVALTFEAWGGSPGVNDGIMGFVDEVLDRQAFQTTSWAVKRSRRGEEETRWTDNGRTEIRRVSWTLVVDYIGS